MLASCTVFNQAHHQAIIFLGFNDDSRNLRLAELQEGFNSPLATDEIVACGVCLGFSRAHGNRTLEPDIGDALDDFLKVATISNPGVENANLIDRDGLDSFRALLDLSSCRSF